MKTILIAGATGFVGKALTVHLSELGYTLHLLTRQTKTSTERIRYFKWDTAGMTMDKAAFEGVNVVINLAGANIAASRWTKSRKRQILESRTRSIELLFQTAKALNHPVEQFISSSAVGYYGAVTQNKALFNEYSNKGDDFIAFVCNRWEKAAMQFESLGVPTLILRKGVVLGKNGGMLKKLQPMAQKGLNVALGKGTQALPWIDLRDLLKLYEFALNHPSMHGVYNVVSSQHLTFNDFSSALLDSYGKKSLLPNAPAVLIKLALGELSAMLLEGTRISNEKLRATGFTFDYDNITDALTM